MLRYTNGNTGGPKSALSIIVAMKGQVLRTTRVQRTGVRCEPGIRRLVAIPPEPPLQKHLHKAAQVVEDGCRRY
jgi:hypothetical protein